MRFISAIFLLLLFSPTAFSFDFRRQSTTALETMEKDIQASRQTETKSSERIVETTIQVSNLARDVGADGNCTVIGYRKIGGIWIARYHTLDPDCPPN